MTMPNDPTSPQSHPLYPILVAAIEQAMFGKGERHGGTLSPFLDQPWRHYAAMHGRGFLTGQAAKKLEEAASTRHGHAFESEMLGAIVYCGMAILHERALAQSAIASIKDRATAAGRPPHPPGGQAETMGGGAGCLPPTHPPKSAHDGLTNNPNTKKPALE